MVQRHGCSWLARSPSRRLTAARRRRSPLLGTPLFDVELLLIEVEAFAVIPEADERLSQVKNTVETTAQTDK